VVEVGERKKIGFLLLLYGLLLLYSSLMPYDFAWDTSGIRDRLTTALDHWPLGAAPISGSDALANILAYVPLGLFAVTAGAVSGRTVRTFVGIVPVALAISATVELLQLLLPSRTPSVCDVVMNVGGAAAGGMLAAMVGRRAWESLRDLARCWYADRPVALAAAVLVVMLVADGVAPCRPTLDVSTVWENVKASTVSLPAGLARHAWHHWIVQRVGVYAALSALLAAACARDGRPGRFIGAILASAIALAVECVKLVIVSRSFNIANVAAAAAGAVAGWLLGAALSGLNRRGQLALAWRAILAYLIYTAWQPFVLDLGGRAISQKIPRGAAWLPLIDYATSGRAADVNNFVLSLALPGALAFAGRLGGRLRDEPGFFATPSVAAVTTGALGLLLELGQLAIVSRVPSITDVLCFAVGGALGAWLAGRVNGRLAPPGEEGA